MQTLEIPRPQWMSLCQRLVREMNERLICLEVMGRPLGDEEMSRRLPLRGLDYDEKGSERDSLTITVGSDRCELTHRIHGPSQLYMALNEVGALEWLAIYERDELGIAETLIHFEPLGLLEPEYLD